MNLIKNKKNLTIIIFLIGIFISVNAFPEVFNPGDSPVLQRIKDRGEISIGVNPDYKPFSYLDESGKRVGVDIDIANLLGDLLKVKVKIVVPKSFSELIPFLLNDKIDIIMADMTKNFGRAMIVNFTDSYFETGLTIMLNKVKAGRDKIPIVNNYKRFVYELRKNNKEEDLIIAVTKGKSPAKSVPVFFPKAQVMKYSKNELSASAVLNNEAHIMVHDETFLNVWLHDNREKTLYKIIVFPETFKQDHYAFAVKKGNQEFLNLLNVFILELKVEGYLKRFMTKYMN